MNSSYLKSNLPIVVDDEMFLRQKLDQRTDEMLFGVFSVFQMSEWATANLKAVEKSMAKLLETISDKVREL